MLAGLDLGSRQVKIVLAQRGSPDRRVFKYDTLAFYREFARREPGGFVIDFARLGMEGVEKAFATGYGRNNLRFHDVGVVTEITAHAVGAAVQTGLQDFVCLDLGGQDSKIIRVREGGVVEFDTNDRCAAGSGRYLESMAAILGLDVAELGKYNHDPVRLNSTCAIFGESELIGKIVEGHPWESLCAGVNRSVYVRIRPWLLAYRPEVIVFTGGVARNRAIADMIRSEHEAKVIVPEHPEYNGAIGCLHLAGGG